MKKDEKQQKAEELHKDLEKARGVVFSGFEGITVAQDTELRRKLAQAGSTYRVVKNTLIERAAQGTSAEPAAQKLRGTTSLAYTESDPVAQFLGGRLRRCSLRRPLDQGVLHHAVGRSRLR